VSKLSKMRLDRLFSLAQQLLASEPRVEQESSWAEPFQGLFGISAICLYDGSTGTASKIGAVDGELEDLTRTTYIAGIEQDDPAASLVIRPLIGGETGGSRIVGAAGLRGLQDPEVTAGPVIALLAALAERAGLRRKFTEEAVAVELEAFRATVFDTLRSECINALTTILTAAGGIREAGPLRAEQLEMAGIVEEEASRLGSVVSWLDRMARLELNEVAPSMDSTDVTSLVAQAVDEASRSWPGRDLIYNACEPVFTVLGDEELIRLVLKQLVDRALQGSAPDSPIAVGMEARDDDTIVIHVSGEDGATPSGQWLGIFERAYVGARASGFPGGAGIGLYVARKIAAAHGGTLDLDPQYFGTGRFAFRFALRRAHDQGEENR
jgi:two-component system, OmpR family, sensor kinase